MRILVDRREKKPWTFLKSEKATLPYGDYTVKNHRNIICIERKGSVEDLFASLGRRRSKFFSNMLIMIEEVKYPFLVIEASISDIYRGTRHSHIPGKAIIGSLFALVSKGLIVLPIGYTKDNEVFVFHLMEKLVEIEIRRKKERKKRRRLEKKEERRYQNG